MAETESFAQSASGEIDRWPWQRRHDYGTFAAVALAHAIVILVTFRLLAPHLEEHRDLDAAREIAADPAVAWVDNSAPAPATQEIPEARSTKTRPRLPFAPGDHPENDPSSRIALPVRPAAAPEPEPEATPEEPAPVPEQKAPPPKPEPVPEKPPAPPKLTAAPSPVPTIAPAPAPKAKPAPAPAPPRVVSTKPAPAPRLTQAPAPKPVLKPAPVQPAPAPPRPKVTPSPAPKPTPAPAPVVSLKPEIVAPPAAPARTRPSPGTASGTSPRPGNPSGQGQSGDLSAYHRLIHDTFHRNWRQPKSLPSGAAAYQTKVKILIARDGTIMDTALVKASGNPVMDESVLRATGTVRRIAPLPAYIESANYSVIINFQLD